LLSRSEKLGIVPAESTFSERSISTKSCMTWLPYPRYAITMNSRLANGEHQITMVAGDHLELFDSTGEWL
jgi:hypothetical protein